MFSPARMIDMWKFKFHKHFVQILFLGDVGQSPHRHRNNEQGTRDNKQHCVLHGISCPRSYDHEDLTDRISFSKTLQIALLRKHFFNFLMLGVAQACHGFPAVWTWGFDRIELFFNSYRSNRSPDHVKGPRIGLKRKHMLSIVSSRNSISLELSTWEFDG